MARIPIIQRTQGISQRTSAGLVPYGSPVADALADAGVAVKDFALREQQSLNSVAAQNAASAATAALTDIRDRAKQVSTDQVETFFKQETEKAKTEAAKGLNSAAARQFDTEWQRSYLLAEAGMHVERRSRVRNEHVARFMESSDANLQTLGRLPAGDPQAVQLEAQTLQGIQDLHVNGLISATDAAKQKAEFQSDLSSTYAYRDLLTDPELAVERLADETYAPYRHLDPDRRVTYAKQARAEVERINDKRETNRIAGEALRAHQNGGLEGATAYLDGLATSAGGAPDAARMLSAIGTARGLVSAADAQESGARERATSDLAIAVARGEAGVDQIEAALKNNDISPSTRATLVIAAEKRREAEALEGEKARQAKATSDLAIAVARGEAGVDQIEAALKKNDISPSTRATLVIAAEKRDEARKEEGERAGQAQTTSDLAIAVARGEATAQQVEEAYNNNLISPSARAVLVKAADALADERAKEALQRRINLAKTQVTVADADERNKRANLFADLSVAAARGDLEYADVDAHRNAGRIDPGQWATLTKTIDRVTVKMNETANMVGLGASFYDGTNVLDPRNNEHVKAADVHFETLLTSKIEKGATSLEIGQFMLDYVERTGFVPSPVKSQIRGGLRSLDPEKVIAAADLFSRMQTINPQAIGDISDSDLTAAVVLNDLRYAGMTDDEAVKEMRRILDPKNRDIANLADADIKEGKFRDEYLGWMKNDFDGWFGSDFNFNNDMTATAKARANYGRLFETFYRHTGDVDQARLAAKMRMERIWGVTSVEGTSRLIEYPPEKVYAPSLPMIDDLAGLIEKDLAESVKQVGGTGKWRIVSDDVTAREAATGRPTYGVVLENENGEFVPVYAKNGVDLRRWGLDVARVRAEWEVSNDIVIPTAEPGLAAARERAGLDKKPIVDPAEEAIRLQARQQASMLSMAERAKQQNQLIDSYQQKWLGGGN